MIRRRGRHLAAPERHPSRTKRLLPLLLAFLLATGGVALADDLVSDPDGVVPVSDSHFDVGEVCEGEPVSQGVLLALERRAAPSSGNVFKDGSSATVTASGGDSRVTVSMGADDTIDLPGNWSALSTGVISADTAEAVIEVDTSSVGSFNVAITFTATGTSTADAALQDTDEMRVRGEVIPCYGNELPVILDVTAVPNPVDEGSSATISVSASDPDDDALLYEFDCDGDGTYEVGPQEESSADCGFVEGPETVTVGVRVSDGTDSVTGSVDVDVANVDPTITSAAVDVEGGLYKVNDPVTLAVSFSDPGVEDTHSCAITWDDGATDQEDDIASEGEDSCDFEHTYTQAGLYNVSVTVEDDDGGSDDAEVLVVVYDPEAGFVTGGGWIDSPAGAYVADADLAGKATFGFVSRYKKGANVPDGNTEFQFKAGDLNFKSTSYEWLVVAGQKAQFKGEGTVNGEAGYGFMLSAIDGDPDTFRIKITGPGGLVYDNQIGASDTADPSTALGGGSVVVHTPKAPAKK